MLIAALGLSLGVAGCKKTVEGENKAWEQNLKRVNEMAALYPSFANALHEQQKKAEDAMTAARAVGNAEESAKKMSDANNLLDGGFVSTLSNLDSRSKSLRTKLISASVEAEHGSDQAGAKAAVDDAQRILRNVDDALKTGAPTADAAAVVVRKLDGDLSSAATNVDKVIASANKRKADAAKAATAPGAPGAPGAATAPGAPATPVAAAQWKCSYCKHMNEPTRETCSQCGAPRASAAAPKAAPTAPPKKK
jgi:hypothetical protein